MPNANDIQVNKISILLKAPPGFGKTIAACSFAALGPVHLSYWDKGAPVELLNFFKKHRPELLKNIDYDVYGSKNAHEYLNKLIGFTKDCRYVAIICDSVTSMTAGAVNWSLGFRDTKNQAKDSKSPDAPKLIPDFDEYKIETSLVTQALDICTQLPCHSIWTAHPLPTMKIEGSGQTMKVTKVNQIVSYGSKVGAIVPGRFMEIYQLAMSTDYQVTPSRTKRLVLTDSIGEDYAKTSLGLPKEFDITDKLFYEVWKPLVDAAAKI